tara:strand:- start:366 stop:1916 length:1551 start_codon:yes stop_codon:yes gene_type:complete
MSKQSQNIRVRFAPSPTGPLHIGGVRTALYNFLYARKNGGSFILRIEDTDQKRFVEGAEKYIRDTLKWCGIEPDEGPGFGGSHGPYKQSERKDIYSSYIEKLLDSGYAYYAFDTAEELDEMRSQMKRQGIKSPTYNSITRSYMKNSLTLPKDDVNRLIQNNFPYTVRIKMPRNLEIKFEDQIRGWVSVDSNNVDDKVIAKSDGMPTYHLANVVDDYLMSISHVIRGEEWLPSAPLHVYLYECLGWKQSTPQFAHLPLILKPDGNGKLSKRDGDKLGFPVFPLDWHTNQGEKFSGFRERGFLPEPFLNMLAFLGWNPGTDKEVFSLTELVSDFKLSRVGKSGAKFDFKKTIWFNQQHIRKKTDLELFDFLIKRDDNLLNTHSKDYILRVIRLIKDRLNFESDMIKEGECFFSENFKLDSAAVQKKWNKEITPHILLIQKEIVNLSSFNEDDIRTGFTNYIEENKLSFGKVMPMLRIAITGKMAGPSLFETIELIGKEKFESRIIRIVNEIENGKNNS